MDILVTGSSGFIGFHTSLSLLESGHHVIGVDCENDYYDIELKANRRKLLQTYKNFTFYPISIADRDALEKIFQHHTIEKVVHLAGQAGVRYSIENPFAYIEANIVGFHNIIHLSSTYKVQKFVYASSSSVYGKNEKFPFSTADNADSPISLYAATKKSNELIAHSYSHIYGLSTIGLRFFTVYGPYGRPDMALFKFASKILKQEEIEVYNFGNMQRDFTYIDDIVEGIIKSLEYDGQYEIFNLGNNIPEKLESMISYLEESLNINAIKKYLPLQDGDVVATWADIEDTKNKLHWEPHTSLKDGVSRFCDWYKQYYKL